MKPHVLGVPAELQAEVRPARTEDHGQLSNLILFESHAHKHLDWTPPLDWLGRGPFVVLQEGHSLAGVLACPPDPPGMAWLRLFAFGRHLDGSAVWRLLWPPALRELRLKGGVTAAAIAIHRWLDPILLESGFRVVNHILILELNATGVAPQPLPERLSVRPMRAGDLPRVAALDMAAFDPLWRNSFEALARAFLQASFASVAEDSSGILGYQLSTGGAFGTHLARLAVHPAARRRGIGASLVQHLLTQLPAGQERRLTVNTQSDNTASHALYARLGFRRTGERFPVFALEIGSVRELPHDPGGPQ